ncbi:condensin-2 complex subunit H2 isoform X2 [Thamnophis elegans]|uniref:condensin-2 complex subunit H2 isoform X2 n=1 Tax=Thamnophis elegans TaxID=35005 RepID=UPI001377CC4E|nr:condensin-2 complex subunit H2 isoform X2 [Thamnophis elegans]
MEDAESRFQHFLQPIRDLTKNWEVDVASQLGEYLEELDQICISFDGGKTTMNFIEAALLIQGSACIYSKKVEYLYTLVYQALDFISSKKREKQPTSVGADGTDGDVSAGPGAAAEEEEFLSLDDIQQASRANMELRDDQQHNTVPIVPLTPMALVPPEESEKKDNPLFSQKGELLASRKDFRMNTCTPHHNGLFVLELAGLSPTQCQEGRDGRWGHAPPNGVRSLAPTAGSMPMEVSGCETPVLALDFSGEGSAADPPDDHGDGGGDVLPDIPEEGQEVTQAGAEEHIAHQTSAPRSKGYALRERPPALDANPHLKDTWDPWRSLDPFSSSEDKPFKKGRPFTVPRGLEDWSRAKRKRRPSGKLEDFVLWFSSSELNQGGNSQRSRRKGPTFPDLEVLYWRNMKERLAAQRRLQKRMGLHLEAQLGELGAHEMDREEDLDAAAAADDGPEDFVADEEIPPLEASEGMPGGVADPGGIPSSLSYEELVNRNVELFMAHSQKYARETVLSRRVRDWEEMMGPQLEEQEARTAFDIHKYGDQLVSRFSRVGEWHSFASLMAGQPAFEVCRAMLASLQLANDYTVEISQGPGLEEAVDTMALRLLTQEKAHQRFHTYTAPSLSKQ